MILERAYLQCPQSYKGVVLCCKVQKHDNLLFFFLSAFYFSFSFHIVPIIMYMPLKFKFSVMFCFHGQYMNVFSQSIKRYIEMCMDISYEKCSLLAKKMNFSKLV